jgi:hypothetical protein
MHKIGSFLVGIAMFMTLPGCACWTDETKKNTPACVAEHDVVDCTEGAVEAVLPALAQIVLGFITQGIAVDWSAVTADAESLGLKDGGCLLAEIQALLNTPSATPAMVAVRRSASDTFGNYKTKHFGTRLVKFKVKLKDGTVVTL